MLSMLRNATKGWTAKILLLLLVASFAVWGVSGSILQGAGNAVITVGGTTVTPVEYRLAYDRQLNQLQQQLGSRITREQADAFGLSANVITNLVSGALLDETAREMGLGMSDDKLAAAIGDDPAFKDASGRFSRLQLQQVLNSIGMPEAQYVETRRAVALRNQLIASTAGNTEMPEAYWSILSRYQAEERKFNFVEVTDADIAPIADPADDVLREYYEANKESYVAPEFRKLNVVKLEAEDIADPSAVSAEDIEAAYETRKDSFSEPEKRRIEQLVFTDREKAQAAADALASGKSFEDVVSEAGKQLSDIGLGMLTKTEIPDENIAAAAFDLDMNTPSDLVDGVFGPVIIRVTEIQPGTTRPLAEVEEQIRRDLALQRATDELFETHDRLEDERAAGETLSAAASSVGLTTRVVEAIDRTARDPDGNIINDLPQSRELLAEAFETDEGIETDPISIGSDGFVWFEVAGVTPERQKEFEEVRETVLADWMAAERTKAVETLAESIRERVAGGEDFNAVIAELLPAEEIEVTVPAPAPTENSSNDAGSSDVTQDTASGDGAATEGEAATQVETRTESRPRIVQQSIPLKRDASSAQLPQAAVAAGFEIPQGAVTVANNPSGEGRIVLQVAEVAEGEAVELAESDKETFNNNLGDDILSQMITRIQADSDVEINQQAINAALAF